MRKKTVFLTGASGSIGKKMTRALIGDGWRVRALVLPGDPDADALREIGCEVVEGDVTVPSSLVGAMDGMGAVYHMAAVILSRDPLVYVRVNIDGTRNVLEEARSAGVEHLIYVSSASVVYPRTTAYSRSKRHAENLVRSSTEMSYTIVRPTLVYDETGSQEVKMFWEALRRFPVVPFIGSGRALKNPVHVDDLVAGLLAIPHNERAFGKTYDFCGGEVISIGDLAGLMLEYKGGRRPFVKIPVPVCRGVAWVLDKLMKEPPMSQSAIAGLTQDADLDPLRARKDLGYDPVGVREGFARCFGKKSAEKR